MDRDKDGKIGFEDFEETVLKEPLLLEAFGPCLPIANKLDSFLKNILGRRDGIKGVKNFYLGLT